MPIKLTLMACIFVALTTQGNAATLFFDNFDGGTSTLTGTTPDITTGGATWNATTNWRADGSISVSGRDMAALSWTPSNGFIYTLDASFSNLSDAGTDWIAMGFTATGTAAFTAAPFTAGTDIGQAWMLYRAAVTSDTGDTFTNGTSNSAAFQNWTNSGAGSSIDLRIVLDTTGGAEAWTATYYAKRPSDGSYTLVRAATSPGGSIGGIGFANNNSDSATIESFSLTSIPEPSSISLLAFALSGLLLRRSRKA